MTNSEAAIANEISDPLVDVFQRHGLTLSQSTESPPLGTPLSAVAFTPSGDPTAAPTLAVAVVSDGELESLDQTVAAVQAALPELEPAEAISVASELDIVSTLSEPRELFTVVRDAETIGILARHADRRRSEGASAVETAAPSPQPGAAGSVESASAGFGLLQDIVLEVSVELGRSSMPLSQLMNLGVGSVVELDRPAGAPVDVRVNGMLFARGEVVALDDEYAVRILEILDSPRP